jgi:hypothetical protein
MAAPLPLPPIARKSMHGEISRHTTHPQRCYPVDEDEQELQVYRYEAGDWWRIPVLVVGYGARSIWHAVTGRWRTPAGMCDR